MHGPEVNLGEPMIQWYSICDSVVSCLLLQYLENELFFSSFSSP